MSNETVQWILVILLSYIGLNLALTLAMLYIFNPEEKTEDKEALLCIISMGAIALIPIALYYGIPMIAFHILSRFLPRRK